jgi:dihydrofolate reductase
MSCPISASCDGGTSVRPCLESLRVARTRYYCAASLDGYIAEADDTIEWLTGYEGRYEGDGAQPVAGGYDDFYAEIGALVSGSVTYEWILENLAGGGEWPYSGKPCWILSSRTLPVPEGQGVDVRIVSAPVADLHGEMLSSAGERDLWIVGGGDVASQFADVGLLDEVAVTIVPVVLGEGKPLFDRRPPGGALQLTGVFPRANGMVELRYAVRS